MVQPEDDNGDWVPGFPKEYVQKWVVDRVPPPHHEKWDLAVQMGVDWKTRDWRQGDAHEFVLEYQARVSKTNPGWIDGYRVVPRP
ncbi:MAG: hypothetical protein ABR583_08650 [Gaiellaceae bacterium]